ncbi:histone demethylase [Achlya hypogyna]|uniref:Histone demethylase n=1 Tax=Achlya hypogyna TaxID=1202772 RepID=A0A1V9ZP34_ACHHY|nr:histone demethylase [Achlya hypogyna]
MSSEESKKVGITDTDIYKSASHTAASAWDKTKHTASDVAAAAWDKTKQGAEVAKDKAEDVAAAAWDKTKQGAEVAKDKAADVAMAAWDKTKEGAVSAKDKVVDTATSAWGTTKEGAETAKDKTSDAAAASRDKTKETEEGLSDKATGGANRGKEIAKESHESSKGKTPGSYASVDSDSSIEMWSGDEAPTQVTGPKMSLGRPRRAPVRDSDKFGLARDEEAMVRLALQRSRTDVTVQADVLLPECATFRPTLEEFASPTEYIQKIAPEARKTGIAKIIPPVGWNPACMIDFDENKTEIPTRLQNIHLLQQGRAFEDGRRHTLKSYRTAADAFKLKWLKKNGLSPLVSSRELEVAYWKIVETGCEPTVIEYANDLDINLLGSGFPRSSRATKEFLRNNSRETVAFDRPEYYEETAWNLNNLPSAKGSCLSYVDAAIAGVTVPWLYFGMLFASFCWHAEDNYMYSVNYMHTGARKRWYGIPSTDCAKFEDVWKANMPARFEETPGLFFHLVTMVSPFLAKRSNVQVFSLVQNPGEFVVTFPQAYHCGFSEGFNCCEAVNFTLPDWVPFARLCSDRYRLLGRGSVFPHDRLMYLLATRQTPDQTNLKGITTINDVDPGDAAMTQAALDYDESRQCCYCLHSVFFSGVICACSEVQITCLRHAMRMCKCPPSSKAFIRWIPGDKLDKVLWLLPRSMMSHPQSPQKAKDMDHVLFDEEEKPKVAAPTAGAEAVVDENDDEKKNRGSLGYVLPVDKIKNGASTAGKLFGSAFESMKAKSSAAIEQAKQTKAGGAIASGVSTVSTKASETVGKIKDTDAYKASSSAASATLEKAKAGAAIGLEKAKHGAEFGLEKAKHGAEFGLEKAKAGAEKSAAGTASSAWEKTKESVESVKDKAMDTASSAWDTTKSTAESAKDKAMDTASSAWGKSKDSAESANEKAKDTAESAKVKTSEAKEKAKDTAESAKDMTSEAKEKAKDKTSEAKEKAKDKTSEAKEKAKDTAESAKEKSKEGAEKAPDTAESAKEKASDTASSAWDKTKEGASSAKEKASDTASSAWDKTKEGAQTAKEKASDTASTAWDKTKEGAPKQKASDTASSAFGQSKESAESAKKETKEGAESAKEKTKAGAEKAHTHVADNDSD